MVKRSRLNTTESAPKSTTKGLRLHPLLRDLWEKECRRHLADERSVAEAWMLAYIEASPQERHRVAQRYNEWISGQGGRVRPGPQ